MSDLDPVRVIREAVTAITGAPTTTVLDVGFTAGPMPLVHVALLDVVDEYVNTVATLTVDVYATTPAAPRTSRPRCGGPWAPARWTPRRGSSTTSRSPSSRAPAPTTNRSRSPPWSSTSPTAPPTERKPADGRHHYRGA